MSLCIEPEDSGIGKAAQLDRFRRLVAEDLRLLAFLHEREPDRDTLQQLREAPVQDRLGLVLRSEIGREALGILDKAVGDLPEQLDTNALDALASEYADIYLTYGYRTSPSESVWLDDDGLERQEPMFRVREWYRRYNVVVSDDCKRPDDHLVFQLQFLAHLFAGSEQDKALHDAADFMDEHLLRWLGQFCGRTSSRCSEAYFVGLALLTIAYVEELRELLVTVLGKPRPTAQENGAQVRPGSGGEAAATAYVPGTGPGW